MNTSRLSVFAVPAAAVALSFSAITLSAQAPAAAPTLLAVAEAPVTYSSSSVPDASATPAESASYAGAASAAPAASESRIRPFSALGIGVKLGIGGIGFDAAVPLTRSLNVRGGAGFFSYNDSLVQDGANFAATLELNNAEAMLDFFPFHGSFRLSAGLTLYNTTSLSGTISDPNGSKFTLGNTSYTSAPAPNSAYGSADFKFGNNVVPRFTLGWGNLVPRKGHWSFDTEIGIEYIGQPTVTWVVNGEACATGSNSGSSAGFRPAATTATPCGSGYGPVATADVLQEQSNLQGDINGLKIFPILSFGFGYKIGGSH